MKYIIAVVSLFLFLQSFAASAATTGSACGFYTDAGFQNQEAFLMFLDRLNNAIETKSVEKFVIFPLRLNTRPRHLLIKNAAQLKKYFNKAFTRNVRKANHCNNSK